ncbi:hypothetical protein L210DRAFT_987126 [Boletus edulis BED1]|uniref:Uncharacterized protein n=1 Tax=Boletus edulis BED1 TaxID=1328754 RepID=A0AAD4BI73_BOLED|nr:hypothetical protein L210DRAFT_987126 [Boletus edulis BED1]
MSSQPLRCPAIPIPQSRYWTLHQAQSHLPQLSQFIRAIILVKGVHFYGFHSSIPLLSTEPRPYCNLAQSCTPNFVSTKVT